MIIPAVTSNPSISPVASIISSGQTALKLFSPQNIFKLLTKFLDDLLHKKEVLELFALLVSAFVKAEQNKALVTSSTDVPINQLCEHNYTLLTKEQDEMARATLFTAFLLGAIVYKLAYHEQNSTHLYEEQAPLVIEDQSESNLADVNTDEISSITSNGTQTHTSIESKASSMISLHVIFSKEEQLIIDWLDLDVKKANEITSASSRAINRHYNSLYNHKNTDHIIAALLIENKNNLIESITNFIDNDGLDKSTRLSLIEKIITEFEPELFNTPTTMSFFSSPPTLNKTGYLAFKDKLISLSQEYNKLPEESLSMAV